MSDNTIAKTIKGNYIFKQFFVDDKTTLEQEMVIKEGRVLKTVGSKNIDFQMNRFQNAAQPHFVIVDENDHKVPKLDSLQWRNLKHF